MAPGFHGSPQIAKAAALAIDNAKLTHSQVLLLSGYSKHQASSQKLLNTVKQKKQQIINAIFNADDAKKKELHASQARASRERTGG